jgi:hypothetical protein
MAMPSASRAQAAKFAERGHAGDRRANRLTAPHRRPAGGGGLTPDLRPVPCAPVRIEVWLIVVVVLLASACERRPHVRAEKRVLALLPLPWKRLTINVAEDGEHVTYAVRDGERAHVVTPAGVGPKYDDVTPPLFSPASSHVLYWGRRDRDGRHEYDVVADTTVVPTPFTEPLALVPSRGGARWAAFGALPPEPGADAGALPSVGILVDGRDMGRWVAASRPDFSPDGAHVAWIAREASGRTLVVVDGTVVRAFETPPPTADDPPFQKLAASRYLSDGRLLTIVPDGDAWAVERDGERLVTYGHNLIPGATILLADPTTAASLVAISLVTAAKAPVAVWWERMAGQTEQWRIVRDGTPVDGVVCDHPWETQPPVLTDDGAHVAYVCPQPPELGFPLGRRYVVLDGRRFGQYVESWTLGLAADGSQVAHGAAESLPIMSWRIFANGVPRSPAFELVWRPRFSPDATQVFWAAGPDRGRRSIGIDMRTVMHFDDILYGPDFADGRKATWVIRRGRKITRVTVSF